MFPLSKSRLSTPARFILISLLVIGVYLIQDNFGRWPYYLFRSDLAPGWPRTVVHGVLYYGIWTVLVPILVAGLIVGPRKAFDALGLNGSVWTALKIGVIATAVLPVTYAIIAPFTPDGVVREIVGGAVLPGIGEEVLYRGMVFGLLFRFAGWGFLPAALLGATIFGIGHFYQGNTLIEFVGIFGITAIASIWWSWMYIEWDNNIWVPAALHILMNGYFSMFDVADGTLGSWTFFFLRGLVVLITIVLTIVHARKRGGFHITGRDWIWRGRGEEAVPQPA